LCLAATARKPSIVAPGVVATWMCAISSGLSLSLC
jgi:hypothetical protein